MFYKINPTNIIFLDIETVPLTSNYSNLDSVSKVLWDSKSNIIARGEAFEAEEMYQRAGIYAEFGKIVCISVGVIADGASGRYFRVKSFASDDEESLLHEFSDMLDKQRGNTFLCGHNIKEFDIPFICRRMLINGLKLPAQLQLAGKKPWETQLLDTMQLWKFGDYKSYTSLKLLAHIFGVPSPKTDIDGSQVAAVYWQDKDLPRIVKYCERDVWATAQVYLKFRGDQMIPEVNIKKVD